MDLFSQKIQRSELTEGDHIYTWRKYIYNHHGIFIGEDKLIHFVSPRADGNLGILGFLASSSGSLSGYGMKENKDPCPRSYCGSEKVAGSGVRMSCIDCFVKTGSLYRFKYEASRMFLLSKLGGTCTTAKSDPPQEVIHRATYLYENGYVEYHLLNNNCEDFALYCKTGLWSTDISFQGRSSQANAVQLNKDQEILIQLKGFVLPFTCSSLRRESYDLGVRKDVEKVAVEELSSYVVKLTSVSLG